MMSDVRSNATKAVGAWAPDVQSLVYTRSNATKAVGAWAPDVQSHVLGWLPTFVFHSSKPAMSPRKRTIQSTAAAGSSDLSNKTQSSQNCNFSL